ncbi:MotA/TolQ/ExbB proton channel family protein [Ponticaulis sp.]|uniref:MotA/TolQ/ExbB proton channel family protein n=1 Tax=Ponticaulis sp. TaxID=2020902 RepID=UPI000B6FBDE2|nr:MotA/TolQ/ExbB proton channel family protein [Ponticaulis sp.]RPG17552.1 MAG: MotA/TolQ/ExbB proton channel family protein [Hyphomonadaceae bacterium TMED125]HBH90579.1 biopolymer transporter ExbB [Hyphomonadaceae bacterium]MAJ08862.1 biopolymer transporter ExbB [Ponticaulis sp.]MDF1681094.1 MotA/TolQ/ExbB proton channel family protein [Ponticaulis sp.]HBJ92035.1 biopolymer transporter ExbB [Hyphomonadaceae bacterium]
MLADLQAFLGRGGPVLVVIMVTTFIMWALILERMFYFNFGHNAVAKRAVEAWNSRKDKSSVLAHWVREKLVSEVRQQAEQNVGLTKAMVALAPLLGLLGTVTGMVTVFDVMALSSGSDAQAMSGGVSRATIPTMAGMVASLSGIIFTSSMDRTVSRKVQTVADQMEIDA